VPRFADRRGRRCRFERITIDDFAAGHAAPSSERDLAGLIQQIGEPVGDHPARCSVRTAYIPGAWSPSMAAICGVVSRPCVLCTTQYAPRARLFRLASGRS
jgi:hypothetical protein